MELSEICFIECSSLLSIAYVDLNRDFVNSYDMPLPWSEFLKNFQNSLVSPRDLLASWGWMLLLLRTFKSNKLLGKYTRHILNKTWLVELCIALLKVNWVYDWLLFSVFGLHDLTIDLNSPWLIKCYFTCIFFLKLILMII